MNQHSRTSVPAFVEYEILPAAYQARDAWVEILVPALEEVRGRGAGTSRSGAGSMLVPPSLA
ncbi:MAG: hypothetical protein GWO04_21105, partial [Actinobacteria bacterium]|nr:hypothetical protein [Actinomycetota bacterium]